MASQFPDFPQQPGQKKSSLMWLWIVLGVIGGGGLLSCVCCGGLSYFGMSAGAKVIADEFAGDPIVQEKLGGITSASMNIAAMGEDANKGWVVLDVKGPKGAGQLLVKNDAGANKSATLRIDGQEFPLGGAGEAVPPTMTEEAPEEMPAEPSATPAEPAPSSP